MSWPHVLCYFALSFGHVFSATISSLEQKTHNLVEEYTQKSSFPFSVPDMILTEEQKRFFGGEPKQGILFEKYPVSKWPNNRIPYTISTFDFTSAQRTRIIDAITRFNLRTKTLKIVPRTTETDYVRVISGNGCYSSLGHVGGAQTLSLMRSGCLSYGTIQHEFLHAAGFTHMQSRPDRDDYVTVLFENIPAEWRSQYEKVSSGIFGNQAKYDYYSVMHYPLNAPGSNKPAFEVKDKTIDTTMMGQRTGPTDSDIERVNLLYP